MKPVLGRALCGELLRVTEAAALAAYPFTGHGDPKSADRAAVDAMRGAFSTAQLDGVVVIGEGEKDEAPMLFNGERVGNGRSPRVDLAVDPLEGTKLLASGASNAITVVGATGEGEMWSPGPALYMEKLVVSGEARDAVDITSSPTENLSRLAKALGKDVRELTVFVLNKPRHVGLIAEIRAAGAGVRLASDGDVLGALQVAMPASGVDALMGTGGTPEGLIAACALRALDVEMQCRLAPQSQGERDRVVWAGLDPARVLTLDDLVGTGPAFFAATGATTGDVLHGVVMNGLPITSSLVIDGLTGTQRFETTIHPGGGQE